jgi:hypothetical protein
MRNMLFSLIKFEVTEIVLPHHTSTSIFEIVYELTSMIKTRLVSLVSKLFNILIGWV